MNTPDYRDWITSIHILDYWRIIKKHLLLGLVVFFSIIAGTVYYLLTVTPIYKAASRILISEDYSRSVVGNKLAQGIVKDHLRFETELKIIQSNPIYEDVVTSLNYTQAPKGTREFYQAVKELQGKIECRHIRNTSLLEIKASSTSPDTAALIANTVVNAYITKYRERQLESSRNTASWLNEQLLDLEYKVRLSQKELQDYISKAKITFVSDGTGLENELKGDIFKAPDETLLDEIHNRLIQARLEEDEVIQRYRGKHPKVLESEAKVAALGREYELEKQRMAQKRNQLTNRIIEARRKSIQYDILKRQVDTNKELYNVFIKKLQEVDFSQGLGERDVRVVETASPPLFPVKPNKKKTLLLGLLLAVSLGIGSSFLRDYMDRSLKTKEEIEALTELPVLSSITALNGKKDQEIDWKYYLDDTEFREDHEHFRELRANIKFTESTHKNNVILVTSSCPGEGKTTVSAKLSMVMAAIGERVLLVDGDLHKPRIHSVFGLKNKIGMSQLLIEEKLDKNMIHRNVVEEMDVMTSGLVPDQPAELIESSMFQVVVDKLKRDYSRIIIDSPSLGSVIDPALLAGFCDGVIIVVDPRNTGRVLLKRTQDQLEKVGVSIVGMVLNKISHKEQEYYYYNYRPNYY